MTRQEAFDRLDSISLTLESLVPFSAQYIDLANEESYLTDYVLTGKQSIKRYTK